MYGLIEEVWHYDKKEKGLLGEYINKFLKVKTEASGWPDNVKTDEEREKYIDDFHRHEGVLLERDKVKKNPGLRQVAKLCLNSLWGRLGMKENKGKTEYVNTAQRFYELLLSGQHKVKSFDLFSDEVMAVEYKSEEDFVEVNASTNVVIAA